MNDNGCLIVGIGDFKIGTAPSTIKTTLGSCIAVCLYSRTKQCGGMLHIMLPDSSIARDKPNFKRAKFADTGIEDIITALKKEYHLVTSDIQAKVFGGAKILKMVSQNIGKENEAAVYKHLDEHKIKIVAKKMGGEKGYQVDFDLATGLIRCRVFGQETEEF